MEFNHTLEQRIYPGSTFFQDLLQSPIQTRIEISLTTPLCTTRSTSHLKETSSNPARVYNNPIEVFSHNPENEGQPKYLGKTHQPTMPISKCFFSHNTNDVAIFSTLIILIAFQMSRVKNKEGTRNSVTKISLQEMIEDVDLKI